MKALMNTRFNKWYVFMEIELEFKKFDLLKVDFFLNPNYLFKIGLTN